MLLFRGWVTTTLVGIGGAMLLAKQRDRRKLFDDYCAQEEAPSVILLERIRYHYGAEFSREARSPRPQIREALFRLSTLKFWFDDPMNVLKNFTERAAAV